MSEELPVFELKMREGATGPMTGANTELFMNGQKMGNVRSVSIEVGARDFAIIHLEMYGQFRVIGKYTPEQVQVEELEVKVSE